MTPGRWAAALAASVLLFVMCTGSFGASLPGDSKLVKGKVSAPETMTPRQVETVGLRRLPRRAKFQLSVTIPLQNCPSGNCQFTPAHPARGEFRTSGKGKAKAIFVMPAGYMDFSDAGPSDQRHFVPFKDDDPVQIHVDAKGRGVFGFANGFSTIQMP